MLEKNQVFNIAGDLWATASKIRGLSELFSMCDGEPPLSGKGIKGLSYMLATLADEIEVIVDSVEDHAQKLIEE